MKQIGLNSLKMIGLLAVVVMLNILPLQVMQFQDQLNLGIAWLFFIFYLLLVGTVIVLLWGYYRKLKPAVPRFKWGDVGCSLLWFVAGRVVAVLATMILLFARGQATTANDAALQGFALQLREAPLPLAVSYILMVGMVAPIVEELVFRGLFTELLFKNRSKWLAGIVTSVVFAFFHAIDPLEMLMYVGIGGILYLSYARRGDVVDSIAVHFLNNFLPSIALALMIFL